MIGFHTCARSRLSAMNSLCASGTSSSAKIASTGHSATHSVQSMHSSGSITSMFGPSRKQSTGQTSTQSVYLHFTQDSVTTYVMDGDGNAIGRGPYYNLYLRRSPTLPVAEAIIH